MQSSDLFISNNLLAFALPSFRRVSLLLHQIQISGVVNDNLLGKMKKLLFENLNTTNMYQYYKINPKLKNLKSQENAKSKILKGLDLEVGTILNEIKLVREKKNLLPNNPHHFLFTLVLVEAQHWEKKKCNP